MIDKTWRTGRRNKRALYIQIGSEPGDLDRCIGMVDSPALAERIVADHNRECDALIDFRDRLAALAAIEDYIAESGQNAARNMRDLLAGTGEDGNDPRVQARRWGLSWKSEVPERS